MATLIWLAPAFCSLLASDISAISSALLRMSGTSLVSISPALCAALTVLPESPEISWAAAWLRSASLRTSAATTAKPRPCSPARAASTAALRASRSVWRAISCTIRIFSAMVSIALTASVTARPEASASLAASRAMLSVWAALSAFCLMLAVICSIEDEASSAEAACSVAPWLSCSEAAAISWLPEATLRTAPLTSPTTSRSLTVMLCVAANRLSVSPLRVVTSTLRLPAAISLMTSRA